MALISPDSIAAELRFDFADSCNCSCCTPLHNPDVYINKHGEVEKFDKDKGNGNDHRRTARRAKQIAEERIHRFTESKIQTLEMLKALEDYANINLEVMAQTGEAIDLKTIKRINRAMRKVAQDLHDSPPSTPTRFRVIE